MIRVIRDLIQRFTPKRQRTPEDAQERVDVVNRQYAAAARLGRLVHRTPEELMEYRTDSLRRGAARASRRL